MFFDHLKELPPDPILGLKAAFLADPRGTKVDLGVGNYKTADLKELVMPVVKEAEKAIFSKENIADYLPIDGFPPFVEVIGKLVFGPYYEREKAKIYGSQAVGGTGALRIGGEFLAMQGVKKIYIPDPTWPTHTLIFERSELEVKKYPYYSKEKKGFDFQGMVDFLSTLEEKSVVLLQASCHNPTGCDPTHKEWEELCHLFQKKKLYPFFDLSYQGLGNGLDEDAWCIRKFAEAGLELLLITTFSKNFSLYSQRVAAIYLILKKEELKKIVMSNIRPVMRGLYSNPPAHGALIVTEILQSGHLTRKWHEELAKMRKRLQEMRNALADLLTTRPCKIDYHFLRKHIGMFSFCNLEKEQVQRLTKEYGIYLTSNGRINVAGLNKDNLEYVALAIAEVSG